ncbi:hypothetical protein DFH08DRAFT_975936 [Mycena albidolilacea]|uniref:Uncharacterized protein n=1 Tax=Mycena albidolilacea TaxID=1033008 RepID=A0AAD7EA31_9AGAR|nr:hypothetical protein DFH08DRAFT_975936 [Mycena albidolilacea]
MAQASRILPPGHLFGHYSNKNELYSVHWGSPDVIRQTPSPLQAPPINHEVWILKFGMAPRTEDPEYEPVAANLLDALYKRFGFTMPPSPDTIDVRDPPEECLEPKHLANVIGMADIANQLASDKALQNILCTFFGQCLKARTVNDVDKALLDYHQPQRPKAAPTGFTINREYLTSMRNPAERMYYYVLAEDGSGIGSKVLLFPRATDVLEVLRQGWGPDIKGVIKHLLA